MKKCTPHGAHVPDDQAVLVEGETRSSGPDVPVYACRDCATRLNLRTLDDARHCSRCGRLTEAYTVRPVDDDRGPLEVVWCQDADGCEAARKKTPSRIPRRAPTP
jgi:hypothetical protein